MNKLFLRIVFVTFITFSLSSCYSSSVLVGDARKDEPMTQIYKKRNTHLIGGLANINTELEANDIVGNYSGYKVNHKISFVDGLLGTITANIYTPSTTTIYVPTRLFNQKNGYQQNNYNQNYNNQQNNQNYQQQNNNGTVLFYHTVKQGETIQSIAQGYNVTVRDIITWNQLNSNTLTPGQNIKVYVK